MCRLGENAKDLYLSNMMGNIRGAVNDFDQSRIERPRCAEKTTGASMLAQSTIDRPSHNFGELRGNNEDGR